MILTKILFPTLGLFTLINCQSQKAKKDVMTENISAQTNISTSENNKKTDDLVYLKEGENVFLKEQKMNVTFKEIASDSRCPKDVSCVWGGEATAIVEIMTVTSRPIDIRVSTVDLPERGLAKTYHIWGYNITLMNVAPYPTKSENVETMKGNYEIALEIKKGKPTENTNISTTE